ncbi:MAG TPA: Qat anti-phage system QueC-like protein QatC [Verrucomicrobiae bacterium]|nr:Qat anti-phage system QueC-like protein QatC [Verrucomicrobiae bacterium]
MKILCTPAKSPSASDADLQYSLFGRAEVESMGSAGPTLLEDVKRFGIVPSGRAWDLLGIALSVVAADDGYEREKESPDGWTREITLVVSVYDVPFWVSQREAIQKMLQFLTGDLWALEFRAGGLLPLPVKAGKRRLSNENCISLLSGGADSLAGAIDLVQSGKRPLFVSQVADGDKTHQSYFASRIAGPNHHLQLSHKISSPVSQTERSQRSRSLIFLAFGIVAATSLQAYSGGETITLFVPENGFISLNVPLTPLRRGSLSTRTTNPFYLKSLQQIITNAGLRVHLENPCQFKTKGELFRGCGNQSLLKELVIQSTSCGRFARMNYKHCGRCVPCLIRRAALHSYGLTDTTTYIYHDLSKNDPDHKRFDDVQAACSAVILVKNGSLRKWVGGALSSAQLGDCTQYEALLGRGIQELDAFLTSSGAL